MGPLWTLFVEGLLNKATCHQASNFWQMVNMSIMSKLDGCQNWAIFQTEMFIKHKGPWSKVSKVSKVAFLLPERTVTACSYRTGMDPDLEAANIGSTQNWASVVTVLRHIYNDICAPLLLWLYFACWFKPVLCWSRFQDEP